MANSIPRWKLYSLMIALVVIGAIGASISKLQGKQKVNDGSKWEHPWFQAFAMFIGETFWLIYYLIQKYLDRRKYGPRGLQPDIIEARKQGLKTRINVFLFALPASWDAIGTAMIYFAYLNIPISVAEMMQGALVFITTLASIIFLKKKFLMYQWGSIFIIMGGIAMVGASSIKNDDGTNGSAIFGISLMIGAMCFQAAQMIIEEKLFRNYYLSPLKVVGFQGVFGVWIYLVFLPIAYFIKWHGDLCPSGRLENSLTALKGLGQNYVLLLLVISLMLDISLYNALGNSITKYASWSNRATVNTTKVVLVWVFFLMYRGDGGEEFHWLQFGGFILIVIGTFIFNYMKDKVILTTRTTDTSSFVETNNVNGSKIDNYRKLTELTDDEDKNAVAI